MIFKNYNSRFYLKMSGNFVYAKVITFKMI